MGPVAVVQGLSRLLGRARDDARRGMAELFAVVLTAAVVAVWLQAAGGDFSLRALVACEALFLAFHLTGSLFARWRGLAAGLLFDVPLRLLVGYAAVNTALFALAWFSPFGIVANFGVVLAIVVGLWVALVLVAKPAPVPVPDRPRLSDHAVGFGVLGLSLLAATLWCQDSLRPVSEQGAVVVFEPWIDGFYHAVHIRTFGAGHGAASIEDFRLAGVPARLYHYGMYLAPALVKQASGLPGYVVFAGMLAPMGVFFTGLAAYALVGSLWGKWPGLAACAALLLLPDGAQQGMRNTFMSYHWLTQISPSATFGVALLAVAWLLVLRGSLDGRRGQVIAGWVAGGLLIFYKAHFFIANALLLLLIPPVFFRAPLGLRKRAVWAATAAAAYLVTIVCVRNVPGLPLLRLDGSDFPDLLGHVAQFTQPGMVRGLVAGRIGLDSGALSNLAVGTPFVLLSALGLWLPLAVGLAVGVRKRAPALLVLFPFILIANFLLMFFGLALDMRSSTPDELSHRPVILMYFFVVTWTGGAVASLCEGWRWARVGRAAIVLSSLALMVVPVRLGRGVQRMWAMPRISPPLQVPAGLVRAAEYVRDHGAPGDLVQDSQLDRTSLVTGLSDRQAFVGRCLTRIAHHADEVEKRAEAVAKLMETRHGPTVTATARVFGIRWFLLEPADQVAWPAELAQRPVFEQDGYRVYRLF